MSISTKVNNINYECPPMYNSNQNNQLLAYMCSKSENIENFEATKTITDMYDPTVVYSIDDIVFKSVKGVPKAFKMFLPTGTPGVAPPAAGSWLSLDYKNNRPYIKYSIVNGTDGNIYININEAGSTGVPPPNATTWTSYNYDNTSTYNTGNIVTHKGNIYKMVGQSPVSGIEPSDSNGSIWKAAL